jgi:hypothetical protein
MIRQTYDVALACYEFHRLPLSFSYMHVLYLVLDLIGSSILADKNLANS